MALILESASSIRQAMRAKAGIDVSVVPANIDESIAKDSAIDGEALALELAAAKAMAVSADRFTQEYWSALSPTDPNTIAFTGTGRTINRCVKTALCRCGGSANKPYCDGTHKTNGFRS